MYVIIAGGGIAGSTLAADLVACDHDVVVIDMSSQACEALYARTGAVTICGPATEIATLEEAGIDRADAAIGAMYRDADNLTFALLAHSRGVTQVVAKMRDPAYEEVYRVAGVTTVCDMIGMLRRRVMAAIEAPGMHVLAPLEGGQAHLVMFDIPESWPAEGVTVAALAKEKPFASGCVITGILSEREERIVMPRGNDRIERGDRIFVVAHPEQARAIAHALQKETHHSIGAKLRLATAG